MAVRYSPCVPGGAVGGGYGNTASGINAIVPGGQGNTAAGYASFAAGYQALAIHDGAFVWNDDSGGTLTSKRPNQFLIRASGGITMLSNSGTIGVGVVVMPGSNPDDATAQLVTIYDRHFTQDEIKGLLQFYGSPLGQKFAAEMPKINGEMQTANRAFSMRIAKDVLQELRKEYPGVAAHARLAKPRPGQAEQGQQQAQQQAPTQP